MGLFGFAFDFVLGMIIAVKLFKIKMMAYNHGVSVFPPETQTLPPIEETAGEPMLDIIRKIMQKGYTEHEAYLAIQAWAYHAKFDLNQLARGVRVYCEKCASEIPFKEIPKEPITWTLIAAVASLAAVALGLYVWVVLDQEYNLRAWGHEWAYLMTYEERIWQAEIFNVGRKQEGMYERQVVFPGWISEHRRDPNPRIREDQLWCRGWCVNLEGRHPILYHVYQVTGFWVYFCGVMHAVGSSFYKLNKGGDDPYKPRGIWTRPGGRYGTSEYDGCWKKWWWF